MTCRSGVISHHLQRRAAGVGEPRVDAGRVADGSGRRTRVEPEAEAVERAQPEVARPAGAVLAIERPPGGLDAGEAERLGRERERFLTNELRARSPRSAGRRAGRASPRRRSGPTPRRGRCSPRQDATRPCIAVPQNTQKRVEVSITPPHAWVNLMPSSWGKVVKKWPASFAQVAGRCSSSLRDLAAEEVDGVIAAPQDPIVLGQPVVVELVGDVGQALAPFPSDRRPLLRGQAAR